MALNIVYRSKGIWASKSYSSLLYFFPILILSGLLLSHIIGIFICHFLFDVSFFSSTQDIYDPENKKLIDAMKLFQFFNAIGVFIIPSILFLHFRGKSFYTYLKINPSVCFKRLLSIFIMALAMIPVANFLGTINTKLPLPEFLSFLNEIEAQTLLITEQFLNMDTYIDLFLMLGLIGFVAAVSEELLFRGVLQNLFHEWFGSPHIAIWLSAFLFSVIHLQYHAILPRFVLGALIGYVYVSSGNLISSMLLHFFYNSSLLVITFFIQHGGIDSSWQEVGEEGLMLVLISVFVLGLFLLDRNSKINTHY
ncbi:MAG: hypothetical protein CM15mP23_18070 [Cryomorphaceae bacterium]|nr:MAG: hypothetical protein CM15mP23_18070 [Cryomorphaceae bacterium]